MVRYKLEPPALPGCIDRPRPLGLARPWPIVVLAAPGGSGKTCLASQIAKVTGGPTAWFLADELDRDESDVARLLGASFARAWRELDVPTTDPGDGAVALAVAIGEQQLWGYAAVRHAGLTGRALTRTMLLNVLMGVVIVTRSPGRRRRAARCRS